MQLLYYLPVPTSITWQARACTYCIIMWTWLLPCARVTTPRQILGCVFFCGGPCTSMTPLDCDVPHQIDPPGHLYLSAPARLQASLHMHCLRYASHVPLMLSTPPWLAVGWQHLYPMLFAPCTILKTDCNESTCERFHFSKTVGTCGLTSVMVYHKQALHWWAITAAHV